MIKPIPLDVTLSKKVDRSGGPDACWPWTAGVDKDGYGKIRHKGVDRRAHRVSYELEYGATDLHILHRCDNPPCCNPKHLFAGSPKDNSSDKVAKNRHSRRETHGRAVLSWDKVAELRARFKSGCKVNGASALSKEFGLAKTTVYYACTGVHWGSK